MLSSLKTLVLGTPGVADMVAADLRKLGFCPMLQYELESPMPSPSDPQATQALRRVLEEFRRKCQEAGSEGNCLHHLHPGINPWAERPELSAIAEELGIQAICPPPRILSLFSNRLSLITEAQKCGVPNLLLSPDPIHSARELEDLIGRIRARSSSSAAFPITLKSIRGGRGYVSCVIFQPEDIEKKLPLWIEQLQRNYSEAIMVAERYLESARYVEVPFARFSDGFLQIFPKIDASIQTHSRKIIEFCPAGDPDSEAGLGNDMVYQLKSWVRKFAEHTKYVGVGVLEFLIEGERAYLVEGLCRLNTSYALWERVAGTKAIAWQIASQSAEAADGADAHPPCQPNRGVSSGLMIRIYAEDPLLQLPQPGITWELSEGRNWIVGNSTAELTMAVRPGQEVLPDSDGLVGLLHVMGPGRDRAIRLAQGILSQIWIAGSLKTNERFVSELLAHPWLKAGVFHAGFVDEEFIPEVSPPAEVLDVFASVCRCIAEVEGENAAALEKSKWSVGDQWIKAEAAALEWEEGPFFWDYQGRKGLSGYVRVAGAKERVCAFPRSINAWQVRIGSWSLMVKRVLAKAASGSSSRKLVSLISGTVYSLLFREGVVVPAHEPLLIVESLRTLVPHAVPIDTVIKRWKVKAEEKVEAGQELAELEVHLS